MRFINQKILNCSCPDGTQAACTNNACVNNQCGTGFACRNGLCCVSNSNVPRCLDGSIAVGACIDCECGPGYTCTTANLCCPAPAMCPTGQISIGPCVNSQCPTNYTCVGNFLNDNCCGAASSTAPYQAIDTIGPCINNACQNGFTCDTTQQLCCPNIGFAVDDKYFRFICVQSQQQCYTLNGGLPRLIGFCTGANSDTCQTGYTCDNPGTANANNNNCCYL